MSEQQHTGFTIGANVDPFRQAMRTMVMESQKAQGQISSAFANLGGLRTALAGLAATLGVIKLGGIVLGATEGAAKLKDLSEKSGMTVESLSGLKSVAKLSETSLDAVAAASNKLSVAMAGTNEDSKGAAAALKALGIDFAAFKDMSPEERIQAVAKAMSGFKDGADKSAVAIALFGKAGADMLPFLKDLGEQGALNAKITQAQAQASDEFHENLVRLRGSGEAWKTTLGGAMAPALRDASGAMLEAFNRSGGLRDQISKLAADGSIDRWTRTAVNGLTYLIDVFSILKRVIQTVGETIGAALAQASTMVSGVFDAFDKVRAGNFSGAMDALKSTYTQMGSIGREFLADQKALWSQQTLGASIREAFARGAGGAQGGPKGSLRFQNTSGKTDGSTSEVMMAQWSAELAAMKEANAQKNAAMGTFYEFSKQEELAFWQSKLEMAQKNGKDLYAVQVKINAAKAALQQEEFESELAWFAKEQSAAEQNYEVKVRLAKAEQELIGRRYEEGSKQAIAAAQKVAEIERQAAAQLKQIEEGKIATKLANGNAVIDLLRQQSQFELDAGLITKAQLLQNEINFEQKRYEIQVAALKDRLALVGDPLNNPVEAERIKQELLQIELKYMLSLKALRNQLALEKDAPELTIYKSMEQAFSSAATGILTQAQNLRDALTSIWKSVFSVFVQEMVSKPLAQFLARAVRETALYRMIAGQQIATQATASAAVAGIKSAESAVVVGENAAEAASGAAASQASIPFAGPALAMAAAAAMLAFVMGFGKKGSSTTTTTTTGVKLPSASMGFDIPAGLNPLTQLHEEEMVLPAHLANPLREQLAGGGAGGAGKGDTYIIQAMDSRSFEQFARDNAPAFSQAVKTAARRGF